MRLSVKFPLTLITPVLGIYLVFLGFQFHQLGQEARSEKVDSTSLAVNHFATLYDQSFSSAARSVRALAGFLELDGHWERGEIEALLRAQLDQEPHLFGTAIAFRPFAYDPKIRLFAPYLYGNPRRMTQLGDSYDYTQEKWLWWQQPLRQQRSGWIAPFLDASLAKTWLVTYSAPFFRKGQVVGVVASDIKLEDLQHWVKARGMAQLQFYIIDDQGRFISHPEATQVGQSSLENVPEAEHFLGALQERKRGHLRLSQWNGIDELLVFYAPIPSTDWTLVGVVPEEEIMAPVKSKGSHLFTFLAATLALIALVAWRMTLSLTRPLGILARSARAIGEGRPEACSHDLFLALQKRPDELGHVAQNLSDLVEKVRLREEQMRQLESQRFEVLVENLPGVAFRWLGPEQRTFEFVSPAVAELCGYPADSFLGPQAKSFRALIQAEDWARQGEVVQAAIASRQHWEIQYRIAHSNGTSRWVLERGQALYDEQGKVKYLDAIALDITALKGALEDLRASRQEVEEARRRADAANQAKSDFLANMSHEIRTPLNAVIGLTHLALDTSLTKRQRGYLLRVQGSAKHLMGLINDILDFSKIEAGKMSLERVEFQLREVLQECFDLLEAKAHEKGLVIRHSLASDVPDCLIGDPLRLLQVLLNLMNNAIKFTEQGSVTLKIQVQDIALHQVRLLFEVLDTGIGMDQETIGRLFQSFSQADTSTTRKYGGTGLGLAISQSFIEMMGGEIQVDSTPGQGSRFYFSLQLTRGQKPEPSFQSSLELPKAFLPAKILVADDNEINRQVAQELLEKVGLEVKLAEDGLEVLAELDNESFDLIFIDIQMPRLDGLETTARIRQNPHWKNLPIVAMTAHALASDRERCLQAGMQDHISKPIEPAVLYRLLARFLPAAAAPTQAAKELAEFGWAVPLELDWQAALNRLNGNQELYLKLLRQLCLRETELDSLMPTEMANWAHNLRGSASNLGADQVSQIAARIESGESEQIPLLREALQELQAGLPTPSQTLPPSGLDPQLWRTNLQALLENSDPGAEELAHQAEQAWAEHPAYQRLMQALRDFDFEKAQLALADLS